VRPIQYASGELYTDGTIGVELQSG